MLLTSLNGSLDSCRIAPWCTYAHLGHDQLKISVSLSPLEQGPHAEFTAESLLQTAESKQATFVLAISAIDLLRMEYIHRLHYCTEIEIVQIEECVACKLSRISFGGPHEQGW